MIKLNFKDSLKVLGGEPLVIKRRIDPQPDGVCYSRSAMQPPIRGNFGFMFKRSESGASQFIRCPYGDEGSKVDVHLNWFARVVMGAVLPRFIVTHVAIVGDKPQYQWVVTIEQLVAVREP